MSDELSKPTKVSISFMSIFAPVLTALLLFALIMVIVVRGYFEMRMGGLY